MTSSPFQMPPPWAAPVGPSARATFPLTWTLRISSRLLLKTPPPSIMAGPVVLIDLVMFPLMTLFCTVTSSGSPLKLKTARPPLVSAVPPVLTDVARLSSMVVLLIVPPPSSSIALPPGPTSAEVNDVVVAALSSI